MRLEFHEQREEDGERQLEHLMDVGDSVLGERDTEVLLHRGDEHLVGPARPQPALAHGLTGFKTGLTGFFPVHQYYQGTYLYAGVKRRLGFA